MKIDNQVYAIYLAFLAILVTLPIIAPILLELNLDYPAKIIYFIYSFACHQFHTRSLFLYDHQFAWCARDTGIWVGWLVAAILVIKKKLGVIHWYYLPIFIIPIVLDGGLQTVFTFMKLGIDGEIEGDIVYMSNNFFRFMTGAFFGLGIGWWFSRHMLSNNSSSIENNKNIYTLKINPREFLKKNKKNIILNSKKVAIAMAGLLVIYLSLIQLWDLTSDSYEPTNLLDSEPKAQEGNFFERRKYGACPTDGNKIFDFECIK